MRGDDRQQLGVFSYVSAEDRIAKDHPLRSIRGMVDGALAGLSEHFDTLYSGGGQPSIAPEKLAPFRKVTLLNGLVIEKSMKSVKNVLELNTLRYTLPKNPLNWTNYLTTSL